MGVGRIFSRRNCEFFKGWHKVFCPGEASMVKFYFTTSEIRKITFSAKTLVAKYKILKFRGPCPHFPMPK